MNHNENFLPQAIYVEHLEKLNGIKFTRREIDIITCLIHGRATKRIASFLDINPKTIENHTRNIMLKLECNSRESIIDFVEKSEKHRILRKYYLSLLIYKIFEKHLKNIFIEKEKRPLCSLVYWKGTKSQETFIHQLEADLKLLGINVSREARKHIQSLSELTHELPEGDVLIYILPKDLVENHSSNSDESLTLNKKTSLSSRDRIFLYPAGEDASEFLQKILGDSFVSERNYYFLFFEILTKLFPDVNLEEPLSQFREQYESSQNSSGLSLPPLSSQEGIVDEKTLFNKKITFILKKKWILWTAGGLSFFAIMLVFMYSQTSEVRQINQESRAQGSPLIRSDLILPNEITVLNRPELMLQIDTKFKKKGAGIQTVAVVGIGGSGKTTLARQYARQEKANVVWEINAETIESLKGSFEKLAQSLSKTEEDEKILRGIKETKNSTEREEKIILFVKERLRLQQPWFLIYDNVEKFADIQKYFPQNTHTWGEGKIILTTRNNNIQNNSQVDGIVLMGELTPNQKLSLFMQIIDHGKNDKLTSMQQKEAVEFLKHLPPFPLDISVAAYYLKMANISYAKYLESLHQLDDSFTAVQENLLKEAGEYSKTRYSIITLSLKRLMGDHEDFVDLLLFISLLDSQNIPKDLLDQYKNPSTVDNFIYNLKKYSLITTQSSPSSADSTLSIHRSTQGIMLDYLAAILDLKRNNALIQTAIRSLENYIEEILDKEDLLKAKQFISHLETLLNHKYLLTESNMGRIESDLGSIYTSLGICKKASFFLEKALIKLIKDKNNNYDKIAQIFLFQGKIYNILADLQKAEVYINKSLQLYKKHMPQTHEKIALGLAYLGNVYRWKGEHEKAKQVFQESLNIYEKIPPQSSTGKAMTLIYLGEVYRKLGEYTKAKAVTDKGFEFCKKYLPKGSVRQATAFTCLGIIEREVGHYQRAIDLMNEGIALTEKNFSKNSIYVSYCMIELAKVYCELGKYLEAIDLTLKAIQIYKKSNVNFNVTVMSGFECLGNAYRGLRNYENAKTYLTRAFIFIENKYGKEHLETAQVLESLGEMYLLDGQLKMAGEFIGKALAIFQKNKHPNAYKCFERSADLHLRKSEIDAYNKDSRETQNLKIQALHDLKKALEIVKTHFPADSPHRTRIEKKIEKLEQG